MNHSGFIESDAAVLLGKPHIKGDRISVEQIIQRLSEGAATEQLQEAYPILSREAVFPALAYASDVISNEQVIAVA
ncbi:hypothetical protein A8C56_19470 [Niabella ginsenosidivorans]|uniref:Antitoxin n=1 Tax=Niabella ginsenosidivorans TaxID=1176587 RepID=A0A1A9I6B1_9BACT|nr:DUF433 domain-containing protein [Niabella ginsenosidivorans]ANH82875.1 hypothetical protein A8C56_19470 [Niabella ginsenosidivorans]